MGVAIQRARHNSNNRVQVAGKIKGSDSKENSFITGIIKGSGPKLISIFDCRGNEGSD